MSTRIDWAQAIRPLLKKYRNRKHPLENKSIYQLVVMVVLSAQSTDAVINSIAPAFFAVFPDMASLARVEPGALFPYIRVVRNFAHKANWLVGMAREIKTDSAIPLSMEELTKLSGIGRKSASVILRGAGVPAEGIIVDIHVLRVAPRLGITKETDPKKMELGLMKKLPREEWEAGMAMSFLGREICKPVPLCTKCLMKEVCSYYKKTGGIVVAKAKKGAAKKSVGSGLPKHPRKG